MYLSLYRKYRPKTFSDVVGQKVIIKTLKNSIINNNFGHAYMFFGPRGVGKTTISKIFARSVNCLENKDGECCEKCENCLTSIENECVDIIEIDAASNNGVDEIRELKNKILLVPNKLKYKVYIIDEVHMLSIGAFNALLKTLEEPPKHVIFILATTDPQKVPDTIVSRCQCFSFKPISENDISDRLKYVCNKEKIKVDDKVLDLISKYSDGGMRDSLSTLDKLVSYSNSNIQETDFYELNGMISDNELDEYSKSILSGDISSFLNKNRDFLTCGKNLINIILQTMYFLHEKVIDYYLNDTKKLYFDIDLMENFIKLINEKISDIKKSDDPRIYIEIIILNFIKNNKIISREIISNVEKKDSIDMNQNENNSIVDENKKSVDDIKNNLEEQKISLNMTDESQNDSVIIKNISEIMQIRMNNVLAEADKNCLFAEKENFEKFKNYIFDQKIGYLACILVDAEIKAASKSALIITYKYESTVDQNLLLINKLMDLYEKIIGKHILFAIVSDEAWNIEKQKYIKNIKDGKKYSIIKEPAEIFEENKKSDILDNETINLFKDVVEIND